MTAWRHRSQAVCFIFASCLQYDQATVPGLEPGFIAPETNLDEPGAAEQAPEGKTVAKM